MELVPKNRHSALLTLRLREFDRQVYLLEQNCECEEAEIVHRLDRSMGFGWCKKLAETLAPK